MSSGCGMGSGCWLGIGLGVGVVCSLLAAVGLYLVYASCGKVCAQYTELSEWSISTFCGMIIPSITGSVLIILPIICVWLLPIWLLPVVSYSLLFSYIMCYRSCIMKTDGDNITQPLSDANKDDDVYDAILNDNSLIGNNEITNNHEIYIWLQEIGLTQYYHTLTNEGYETINDILTINEEDLIKLNITKHLHVKKIMGKIRASLNLNIGNNVELEGMDNVSDQETEYI